MPFGEYVPFRGFFKHLADLSSVPLDAIPGHGNGVLHTPVGPLGTLVSYEVFDAAARVGRHPGRRTAPRRSHQHLVLPHEPGADPGDRGGPTAGDLRRARRRPGRPDRLQRRHRPPWPRPGSNRPGRTGRHRQRRQSPARSDDLRTSGRRGGPGDRRVARGGGMARRLHDRSRSRPHERGAARTEGIARSAGEAPAALNPSQHSVRGGGGSAASAGQELAVARRDHLAHSVLPVDLGRPRDVVHPCQIELHAVDGVLGRLEARLEAGDLGRGTCTTLRCSPPRPHPS